MTGGRVCRLAAAMLTGLAATIVALATTGRVIDAGAGPSHGIAGVEVSNGVEITASGPDGTYSLPDRPGGIVFVIKPRGWRPRTGRDQLPQFYARSGEERHDFGLERCEEGDAIRVLVLSDTQPADAKQVGYLDRGVTERIPKDTGASFGVTLGDVVYDRPDLFGAVNAAVAKIGLPWYNLPGNHDVSLATPDEQGAIAPFEAVYGPSTYAFHAGPALFVALDDVRPFGGPRYMGGLTKNQFTFLANLLRGSPLQEWVVLMMHIPIFPPDPSGADGFRAADRLRLFDLLRGRPRVLILSGHTHYQRHVLHGENDGWTGPRPLHEYNVAAACGGFWGGPTDRDGIPVSTMWDGTPPGYALVGFSGDNVSLDYYPAREPADHQMALHVPKVVAPAQGFVSFYANIFNGYDAWDVRFRVDDGAWNNVRRILGWDPSYSEAFLAQDTAARPPAGPRLPDPAVCYHLWRGPLPANLSLGTHRLEVMATDPTGKTFRASQTFDVMRP